MPGMSGIVAIVDDGGGLAAQVPRQEENLGSWALQR